MKPHRQTVWVQTSWNCIYQERRMRLSFGPYLRIDGGERLIKRLLARIKRREYFVIRKDRCGKNLQNTDILYAGGVYVRLV